MNIRFQFDPQKAVQAMAYLVARLNSVDKVALTKLLYIADRDYFLSHGHPITGDRLVAMDHGPLPSACLDLLDGETNWGSLDVYEFLHRDDYALSMKRDPGTDRLSTSELQLLDAVVNEHGHKNKWALRDETHQFPEYREVYIQHTSTPIDYEAILKHHGGPEQYRYGRPVVTREMAANMKSPFPVSEPDL